ncbi:hypothetical protein CW714_06865, partial [Methanophagales archaeon]
MALADSDALIRLNQSFTLISSFTPTSSIFHHQLKYKVYKYIKTIPAAFVGAPEADTALSLLPAHRLLLEGRAYEATVLSAIGSFGAVIFSL